MEVKTVDYERVCDLLKYFCKADEVGQERIYTTARVTHDMLIAFKDQKSNQEQVN